ncbi:MAG: hypothetical protein F6J94_13060 [Moorea sp. SIO1F2]|uniref:hypothetical protein n=1 Tax=Moorena sp. SIO1F2 TaxID=2607819 RepID=UPI0013BAB033|nr:hypothetical protein [Moorena sp. SIO1F2]NET82817.1 hypothetical protein [Moorena sp. SIO1F2]
MVGFVVLRFGQSPTLRERNISLGNAIDLQSRYAIAFLEGLCKTGTKQLRTIRS